MSGIQGGAHDIGVAVERLFGGDGEMGHIAESRVDVADQVTLGLLQQGLIPGFLAVILAQQRRKGTGVADLDPPGVEKTDIDKAVVILLEAV